MIRLGADESVLEKEAKIYKSHGTTPVVSEGMAGIFRILGRDETYLSELVKKNGDPRASLQASVQAAWQGRRQEFIEDFMLFVEQSDVENPYVRWLTSTYGMDPEKRDDPAARLKEVYETFRAAIPDLEAARNKHLAPK